MCATPYVNAVDFFQHVLPIPVEKKNKNEKSSLVCCMNFLKKNAVFPFSTYCVSLIGGEMGPQIGRNTERPEQLSIAISSCCKTLPLKLSWIWWLCRFVFKF